MLPQNLIQTSPLWVKHRQEDAVVKSMAAIRSTKPSHLIAVRKNGRLEYLRTEEILRCVSDSNYCSIYYGGGMKVMVARTLKSMSNVLLASGFLRVHRSHIIHQDAIHQVFNNHIELHNGDSIPMSRRYKKRIIKQLIEICQ